MSDLVGDITMKITLFAFGSRGDVQPYVALGKGLQAAGHDVLLCTHQIFEPLVQAHGLKLFPVDFDPRQVLLSQAVADIGGNPFKMARWMTGHMKEVMDQLFEVSLAAAEGADLLLNSTLSFAGYHVAEKLNIPAASMFLQPVTPTREFPGSLSPVLPAWLPLQGGYNRAAAKLMNQFVFSIVLPMINERRIEMLGLPPLSRRYYWSVDSTTFANLTLYGFSGAVIPKPADWTDWQQVTGYWFLDSPVDYRPTFELYDFLASGRPPVYIGFGSMIDHEKEALSRLVVEAVEKSGQRAVLLGGWSGLGPAELPGHILRVDEAPHDWLFPQMAAVVHHGGAGTTAAGFRAGAPTVVVPFFADQHFWGARAHRLGVGSRPIPRKKLTADRLAAAIRQAVEDKKMRARAAALGARIRAEDGVGAAVAEVERFLADQAGG